MRDNFNNQSRLELWLSQNSKYIYYTLLVVFVVFSFLHFSLRLSISGDDSAYITRAINFIESGKFPDYQAPLYPIFLSLFTSTIGINIFILKLSSLALMLGFMVIFYRSFKDRITNLSLFYAFAILSVSSHFVFFSSQTFSEPLFLLVAILFIAKTFSWIDNKYDDKPKPSKFEIKQIIIISGLAFTLFLTRSVGIGAIVTLVLYCLIDKKYTRALYFAASFAIFMGVYLLIKNMFWDIPIGTGEQASQLLHKHPYNIAEGKETIEGFFNRFIDNSNLYLSKHFLRFIGFRSDLINSIRPTATIVIYIVFIWGFVRVSKTNKHIQFIGVFIAIMLGITFVSLQKLWDQYRLIIPFLPFMLLFLTESIQSIFNTKKGKKFAVIIPVILLASVILTTVSSVNKLELETLSKNIKGDKYAGFTNDWVNYLKMVEYSKNELPKESYVACRKPNIARIYANGKLFYGIYRIPSQDSRELAQILKDKNVTHVIMGTLRKNPAQNTGKFINTIHRYIGPIVNDYPHGFSLIHKFGEDEPAYLFKINYDKILNK